MPSLPASVLEEIIRRLVEEFDPEAIYLFGSHAWGEPDEDSDVDLMIVVPWDRTPTHRDSVRAHQSLSEIEVAKDILLRTHARFERFRPVRASLEYKIAKRGRLLYERPGNGRGEKRDRPAMADQG
ncbi:MAG: nucleotidyltransferase domain-containing protein [Truepera sp.]|nr:nucleotidyltransferase domain-containing protein [Truepera sp.]